jgi:hypothetical protein
MFAVEWSQGIEDAFSNVAEFVPKLLGFLVILLIGYLVVKAISRIADAALERTGFDRAVERGGIKRALERSEYDASDIVSKVIFYGLFLLVLQAAFGVFGENPVSELITSVIAFIPKVLAAIAIIVIMSAVAAAAKVMIQGFLGTLPYARVLANVASGAIVAVGFFAALSHLEIAPAIVNGLFYAALALIAGSGIIAIGFGGVQPMQQVWQDALGKVREETPRIKEEARARKEDMIDLTRREQQATPTAQERTTAQERLSSPTIDGV